ncbi:MAG: PD-(D/E)XK nuclease family protein [Campylobacterales bacterium]|nr:PD-(D/E)XK nuclease family protein [Campylobacterales bacterium]
MTQPSKTLHVLPTARAIREHLNQQKQQNGFGVRYITMGEFLSRLVLIEDARRVDADVRNLMLLEASRFERFDLLHIERTFFAFVQNSHYIFRFLEELSGECVSIEALQRSDTYGDYEEHLRVLQELRARFAAITQREGVVDAIFLRERYRLHVAYITSFSQIQISSVGYLTAFEMELLAQASRYCTITIDFESTPYNQKMRARLSHLGLSGDGDGRFLIDVGAKKVTVLEPREIAGQRIEAVGLTQRMVQVAFIKERVNAMVRSGIKPEAIAVVLPDEHFAEIFRTFDSERNFNFAMGLSLRRSRFYLRLSAFAAYMDDGTVQNFRRCHRLGVATFALFTSAYAGTFDMAVFRRIIEEQLSEEQDAAVVKRVQEELFHFERLGAVLETLRFRQAFHLFMQRLDAVHLDDVGGGKVTVMGLLETRGVRFEGVVIVDFNEGFVPKISEKDLFLNSQIRERSALPTSAQRQDLQKHYYYQLIHSARSVAISYVHHQESVPSRFLTQMHIASRMSDHEAEYARIMFEPYRQEERLDAPLTAPCDFRRFKLSATMLQSYLTCKRQFYYRYMQKLQPHRIERDLPEEWEIGNHLHEALRHVYAEHDGYASTQELEAAVETAFGGVKQRNPLVLYQLRLWREKLRPFYANEVDRYASGIRVRYCECALECVQGDLTLQGRIDRIDATDEGLEVLDYKSGAYRVDSAKQVEESTNFQLEFYYLLASTLGRVKGCGYYDLNSGRIEPEAQLDAKLERLERHFQALPRGEMVDFERTEVLDACRVCDYNLLCGRW